jgi:hypothetical protein
MRHVQILTTGMAYTTGALWVDGQFIRDLPDQEFARGNFHKVPLITNRDAYEGVIFSNKTETSHSDETVE